MELNLSGSGVSDLFDFLPDPIILQIFNKVSDIQTLSHCRAVSKRFNSLAVQSESLILRVDRVISDTASESDSKIFMTLLRPILKCFNPFTSPKKKPIFINPTRPHDSPARILHGFESIRSLQIELPAGDLRIENDSTIKWAANFGKTLKSCVILGFRNGTEADFGGSGLKTRVAWTISSLISASARHYMMLDVVREQTDLTSLVVKDKDDEGTIVMDKMGLEECRKSNKKDEELSNGDGSNTGGLGILCKSKRTKLPAVRMRIRHMPTIELDNGDKLEGATLVVIRPTVGAGGGGGGGGVGGGGVRLEAEEYNSDVGLAMDAFGSVKLYKDAVDKLLKSRSYVLEMNSF